MFGNLSLTLGSPWWLIALPLVLPPLILVSFRSLSGLGMVRRALAILLRTAVVTLIVLALAEVQTVRRNDKLTTLFLVDASQSIPRDWQGPALQYVTEASKKQAEGRPGRGDRLRQGAEGGGAAGADRGQPARDREHDRPRVHRHRLGDQARPGHLPRGHRAAARGPLRRQREPRQRGRAGPGRQGARRADRRPADRVLLRPRGPGREGLAPPRRQEGGDGQHQRRRSAPASRPAARCRSSRSRRTTGPRPPATRSRSPSSSSAGSTSARSSSRSPSPTSTPSPPSSSPTGRAATAAPSTTSPRGSPTRGGPPRSC